MQPVIKAVIFDLDGVLIDSNPVIESFWKDWAVMEGIHLTDNLTREWVHGRKVTDTIGGLFSHLDIYRKKEIEESGLVFDKNMQPDAVPGVSAFINMLRVHGIPLGVVTSSHHSRMLKMLVHTRLQNSFTHFVTGENVLYGKPHPEPYLTMQQKMGVPAAECLVFEDALSGIRSAVDAGMHVAGIGNALAAADLMSFGADVVIPDFTNAHIHGDALLISKEKQYRLA